MAHPNDYERDKIPDTDLRSFADGDADERLSVLVELKAAAPALIIGDRDWGQPSPRALTIGKRDDDATADQMARLQKQLVAILGEEPVRLDLAEVFVADVTAAQLREIARLTDVGYVRPNRRHRAE
jgi:hypothetical protein